MRYAEQDLSNVREMARHLISPRPRCSTPMNLRSFHSRSAFFVIKSNTMASPAKAMARRGVFVCDWCLFSNNAGDRKRLVAVLGSPLQTMSRRNLTSHTATIRQPTRPASEGIRGKRQLQQQQIRQKLTVATPKPDDPNLVLQGLIDEQNCIAASDTIPDEHLVLELLERCHRFANTLIFGRGDGQATSDVDNSSTPASSLLDLDESSPDSKMTITSSTAGTMSMAFRERSATTLTKVVFDLLRDPKIFITPMMLQLFVRTQALIAKPETIPEIFHLYATKPAPVPGSNPIKYRQPSPRSPKNAIPLELSDAALDAAILQKDLPLALSVIETTVATPAYRRNKVLRKASGPLLALGVTPIGLYIGADAFAKWQNTFDADIATYMAMGGTLAYVGTLATIGFVAVTTSNDQMERVVWQPGMRLRDRWLREEERLYFDRVALAWGFKEKWRRGEEQGEDWEALREFCGRRGFVLDKTDLMEGME